ncbi:MAG TPA: DUF885 domain-containing protein [Bacteroidia bacterium]|nr:DUF885 domain-containing protein [Bacteroidia bacterium]
MKKNKHPFYYVKLLAFTTLMIFGSYSKTHAIVNEDQRLEKYKKIFIENYWKIHPVEAIFSGYHKNDSLLTVPNMKYFDYCRRTLNMLGDSLKKYDEKKLSVNALTDYKMMQDRIEADLWYINTFKEYEWNPAWYNIGGEFAEILNSDFAKLNERLRIISMRLTLTDNYFRAAMENIKNPVIEHTDLAILQNEGSIDIFRKQIRDSIAASTLSIADKKVLHEKLDLTVESISTYIEFLKTMRSTMTVDNSRSFRIGKELYDKKFLFDIRSGYTAEQIYEKAVNRKAELHTKMAELARFLWPKYLAGSPMPDEDRIMIRMVIDKISEKHVPADSFMLAIEKQIPELVAFVNKKNLLYLDPSKPLVVRKTPSYMEGSGAGASISSPGPYDLKGNTYYNVSPLTGYTPERAESYLREYNHYILQILNIHEAIPGHYAQLVYSNQSPSLIKSILGNGAMVEGWAVYTERMMLDEGYGDNQPEMWLMYYKWHLRSVCNTILDYSVHVLNWPEKVAVKFLTDEAFQQTAEAQGKWTRVRLSQVQLCSYFTGYTEIYDLREDLKSKQKGSFDLKQFHEKFLSYGSAPVKYIRELMLSGN